MSESKKPAPKTKKPATKAKARPVFELAPKVEKPLTPDKLPWKTSPEEWIGFEILPDHTVAELQGILEGEPPAEIASKIVKRIGELVGAE